MLCSATTTAADTLRPRASKGSLKQLDLNAAAPSFSPTTDDTAAAAASVPGSADDDNLLLRVLLPQKSMVLSPSHPQHTQTQHTQSKKNSHKQHHTLHLHLSFFSSISSTHLSLSLSLSLSLFNMQEPYLPSSSSPYLFSSISQTHHLSFSPSPYVFLVFYLQNPSSLIFSISLLLFYLLNPSFLIFSMSLPCVLSPQLISLFLQSSKPISLGHGLS
jgi:hypothetical protein